MFKGDTYRFTSIISDGIKKALRFQSLRHYHYSLEDILNDFKNLNHLKIDEVDELVELEVNYLMVINQRKRIGINNFDLTTSSLSIYPELWIYREPRQKELRDIK